MPYTDPEKSKACRKRWAKRNRPHFAASALRWRRKHPEHYLWCSARARAIKKGLAFTITKEDVVIPKMCPVLGIPLMPGVSQLTSRSAHPNAPSIDRVVSKKGYVPGNIRVISWRANSLKKDGTPAELLAVALYVIRQKQDK